MLYVASSFYGNLNKWNVAKVTVRRACFMVPRPSAVTSTNGRCKGQRLTHMVYGASSFNGNLYKCDAAKVAVWHAQLMCLVLQR